MMTDTNERGIGDNGGEPLDPFAAIAAHIADLKEEGI
jgi:hypothetical protein